jgi:enoyl-CoA hydratase/carnithine racemase
MTAARDLALETLQLEQDGRVLTARFSNPPLNFMTTGFIRELDQLTSSVDRDPTVGAVVLTGGVEGRFLTHLDAGLVDRSP